MIGFCSCRLLAWHRKFTTTLLTFQVQWWCCSSPCGAFVPLTYFVWSILLLFFIYAVAPYCRKNGLFFWANSSTHAWHHEHDIGFHEKQKSLQLFRTWLNLTRRGTLFRKDKWISGTAPKRNPWQQFLKFLGDTSQKSLQTTIFNLMLHYFSFVYTKCSIAFEKLDFSVETAIVLLPT